VVKDTGRPDKRGLDKQECNKKEGGKKIVKDEGSKREYSPQHF